MATNNTYYVDGKVYTEDSLIQDIQKGELIVTTNNPKTTINVDSTSYNIESHWLEIASKYFNIDQSNTEAINFLKAGFFGYFNEIAANEVKNAVYHRKVLYNEHFLNTASFKNSILNFAKLYNVPLLSSTPASMSITFAVKKTDLINSSMKTEIESTSLSKLKTYEIIVDKDYDFSIQNYIFKLPYNVQIIIAETTDADNPSFSAVYKDDGTFPFMKLDNPYITTWQDTVSGEPYIFFIFDIFQMELSSTAVTIDTSDTIDSLFYNISFSDQLAYFEVWYFHNSIEVKLNTYFNNTFTPRNDEYFCYYNFIDDGKLQISFSNLSNNFRPASNSTILVKTYTTKGKEGNLNYLGEVTYNFSNSSSTSFSKMAVQVATVNQSFGGKNELTTTEMKQTIIEEIKTRNSLITDSDLEIYFKNLNNVSLNNSEITFMKRRDDLLKRVYSAFLLLRDSNQMLIPTNTIPKIFIPDSFFEDCVEGEYFIPEYTTFIYYPEIKTFIAVKDFNKADFFVDSKGISYSYPIAEDKRIYYKIPYLLKLENDPILMANYYSLYINENFNLTYLYINSSNTKTFSINTVNIKKEIELENTENTKDTYRVSFNLNTSLTTSDELDKILIRGVLYNSKTNSKYGYIDFKRTSNSDSEYYGNLITNRKFSNNKLTLYNSLYNELGKPAGSEDGASPEVVINEDVYMKIGILYKDDSIQRTYSEDGDDSRNLEDVKDFLVSAPVYKNLSTDEEYTEYNINDYVIINVSKTSNDINLFKNLSKYLNSIVGKGTSLKYNKFGQALNLNGDVVTNIEEQTSEFGYFIEMLPVISFDYFQLKYDSVYSLIDKYLEMISNVSTKLENNTDIDLKFYNTFGPSNYYYLSKSTVEGVNTSEDEIINYEYISKIDVLLDLTIYLYSTATDSLDKSIKQFISEFIEECNTSKLVPISNLLRLLEMNFKVIKFIEYNGLSGEYSSALVNTYQKIENRFTSFNDMTKDEIIEYVPEYINIKKDATRNTTVNDNGETVDLGVTYDYVINITYKN